MGPNTGIPRPRTCARVIGNDHLLVYRNAATELYDVAGNRMLGMNSLRSGCTTSFIPAGGIMTAPMLGHGCVCNYPMFASLALYHCPAIEPLRPTLVSASWRNRADEIQAKTPSPPSAPARCDPFAAAGGAKADLARFRSFNCTLEAAGSGFRVSSKDRDTGYVVCPCAKPLEKAVFTFFVKRTPGTRRHGNVFFVFGQGDHPDDWTRCQLYYGGRSSMAITGSAVEHRENKLTDARAAVFQLTVRIDCSAQTIRFEAAGKQLDARFTKPIRTIICYGCGGSNADNTFSEIAVQ